MGHQRTVSPADGPKIRDAFATASKQAALVTKPANRQATSVDLRELRVRRLLAQDGYRLRKAPGRDAYRIFHWGRGVFLGGPENVLTLEAVEEFVGSNGEA